MFEKKVKMYITDVEQAILIVALIDMKNFLLKKGKYTDCIDELLLKVIEPKRKKINIA